MTKDLFAENGARYKGIVALLLAASSVFCWGLLSEYIKDTIASGHFRLATALILLLLPITLGVIIWLISRSRMLHAVRDELHVHSGEIEKLPASQIGLWIALVSGVGLYLELLIVRFHGASFMIFSFYKNVSLFSCFLGLGIGYAIGEAQPLTTPLVLPLLAVEMCIMHYLHYHGALAMVKSPAHEAFNPGAVTIAHFMTTYAFMSLVFGCNAFCFIPLGQLASRLMLRKSKLTAYGWNLIGSIFGIALFTWMSFMETSPAVWILFPVLVLTAILRKQARALFVSALSAVILLTCFNISFRSDQVVTYSPYQVVTLTFHKDGSVGLDVNNMIYQGLLDLREWVVRANSNLRFRVEEYAVPYLFKRNPKDVLIVGSGTGNDVAAGLREGAGNIDAVEIDPAIIRMGKLFHPESPYDSNRVHAFVNDARAFIRNAKKKYDVIVYGLIDSHTIISGLSNIRLDSFVYTVEGFREARRQLKDGGLMSVSFCLPSDETKFAFGRKIFLMLKDAFGGRSPVVYYAGTCAYAFLIGDAFSPQPLSPSSTLRDVTPLFADSNVSVDKATDDWPFIYITARRFPGAYIAMILILSGVSLLFIRNLIPDAGSGFSAASFFLGAGFMLVEAKGITELALAYGTTWVVISVVIFSILIMAFLANLLVANIGIPRRAIVYGFLFVSLAAGLRISSTTLNDLAAWQGRLAMTILLTLPLFFSGIAFSAEILQTASIPTALSANLMGAMLGGFLEYNSLWLGFRSLYFIALVMYGLAYFCSTLQRDGSLAKIT